MVEDQIDFKIVLPHWGHEYEYFPSEKIMKMGHAIVQAGADLIVGSHPHVQQPYEICLLNQYPIEPKILNENTKCQYSTRDGKKRKALILYSLGNFSTAMFTFPCELGVLAEISVTKNNLGVVDWFSPRAHLVINLNPMFSEKGRKLLLLKDHWSQEEMEDHQVFQRTAYFFNFKDAW